MGIFMTLKEYVKTCRGNQAGLAKDIGVSPSFIWQIVNGLKPVPLELCAAIELSTNGAVSRRDLRPKDWQQIWPELRSDPCVIPLDSEP
jgi:DNA-binding transcriptional regulator YdaS (Cro superfamily)